MGKKTFTSLYRVQGTDWYFGRIDIITTDFIIVVTSAVTLMYYKTCLTLVNYNGFLVETIGHGALLLYATPVNNVV